MPRGAARDRFHPPCPPTRARPGSGSPGAGEGGDGRWRWRNSSARRRPRRRGGLRSWRRIWSCCFFPRIRTTIRTWWWRSGQGWGQEAALFAGELLEMYRRYAERRRCRTCSSSPPSWAARWKRARDPGPGRVLQAQARIGGHRVQRVPVTESGGRTTPRRQPWRSSPRPKRWRYRSIPTTSRSTCSGPPARRPERQHHGLRRPGHPQADRDRDLGPGGALPAPEP